MTTLIERIVIMSTELHAKIDALSTDLAGLKSDVSAFAAKNATDTQALKDSLAAALAKGDPPSAEDLAALDSMKADVDAMRANLAPPAAEPAPEPAPTTPDAA